jgi:hypothetical protein
MFQFMSEDEIGEYMSILARDFKTLFPKEYLKKAAQARVAVVTQI